MKLVFPNILVLLVLMNGALPVAANAANSSTDIAPIVLTSKQIASLRSVVVMHITGNGVNANHSVFCPQAGQGTYDPAWTGMSPVQNATLAGPEKWYPNGPTALSNGIVVYYCNETYWSTDPYYIALSNASPTITCQASGNGATRTAYPPEQCTIQGKDNNRLSGVLPIRFVFHLPPQDMVAYYNYLGKDIFAYFYPQSTVYVYLQPPASSVYTITYPTTTIVDASRLAITGSTTTFFLNMRANFYDQSGNVIAASGSYLCPGSGTSGFVANIPITNDMLGKTCEISCTNPAFRWTYPAGGGVLTSAGINMFCHD